MPIYEYECRECGHKLEIMQRMSEERLKTCPDCNEEALTKLISAVSFQLKGTGWYETDFKHSGKPDEKPTDGGGGSDSDTSAAKAGDAADKSGASDSKSDSGPAKSADADSKAPGAKKPGPDSSKSSAKTAAD